MADDHWPGSTGRIEFYFKRLDPSGATLVVVVVGAEVYGACDVEPLAALHIAAWRASEDLARRRHPIDPKVIMDRGRERLRREMPTREMLTQESFAADGAKPGSPLTFPRQAA